MILHHLIGNSSHWRNGDQIRYEAIPSDTNPHLLRGIGHKCGGNVHIVLSFTSRSECYSGPRSPLRKPILPEAAVYDMGMFSIRFAFVLTSFSLSQGM
jgi:hypothetical protein